MNLTPIVIDVETSTKCNGNPFTKDNKLLAIGVGTQGNFYAYKWEYMQTYDLKVIEDLRSAIESQTGILVGFNIKFDLHWIRNIKELRRGRMPFQRVWDCQLAHFILNGQERSYPSLDEVLAFHNLPPKLNVVKTDFWDQGLDTEEVPWEILSKYLIRDLQATMSVFEIQKKLFEEGDPRLYITFKLQCEDLLVLEEMEFNGLYFDRERSLEKAKETKGKINSLLNKLAKIRDDSRINWTSNQHLSCILYGGKIPYQFRETVDYVLVDGTPKTRERWATGYVEVDRIADPPAGSEGAKTKGKSVAELDALNHDQEKLGREPIQRIYSVNSDTLRKISKVSKEGKQILEFVKELKEQEKLLTTYYEGLPQKQDEFDWPKQVLYGQYNQVVVKTGRLSSSNPNLQNLAAATKELYVSRF